VQDGALRPTLHDQEHVQVDQTSFGARKRFFLTKFKPDNFEKNFDPNLETKNYLTNRFKIIRRKGSKILYFCLTLLKARLKEKNVAWCRIQCFSAVVNNHLPIMWHVFIQLNNNQFYCGTQSICQVKTN
jgi:hypothetical protein